MSLVTVKQTKRVLVVDDVPDNLFLAQVILETQGYQVDTARSGKTALTLLETETVKPDLIVLDLMMPKMNGYEVIVRLHNRQNLSNIPILLVTGNTSVSFENARSAGAEGLLYKPLDMEQFLNKIERLNI